jgi:Holliday junction resolvase RusA-like endonuclease
MIDIADAPAAAPPIRFTVAGTPVPGGSKKAWAHPTTGRILVADDSGARGREWRARVAAVAQQAWPDGPLEGPLVLTVTFHLARPKGHFGTGKNARNTRPSAPLYPANKPDTSKLVRALEDALTGVLWRDDSQVVTQHVAKRWGVPGADVEVRPMAEGGASEPAEAAHRGATV